MEGRLGESIDNADGPDGNVEIDNADGLDGNVEIEGSVEMLGLFSRLAGNVDGLNMVEETSRRDSSILAEETRLPSIGSSLFFSSLWPATAKDFCCPDLFPSSSFSTIDFIAIPSSSFSPFKVSVFNSSRPSSLTSFFGD